MDKPSKEANWYFSKKGSGEREGPFDWEQLKELVDNRDLEPEDFLWREGFDDWKKANSVESVDDLFVSPPPLPEESSQESVEEDAPPSLPQSEKSEAGGELHDENGRESTSEDTATSNSSGSKSEQNSDASDERYWYNKKRWAIPFLWALVPAILWNGYEKYVSGRNEHEWFEEYVSLYLQLAWFPPIGWYGLYKTNKTDKVGSAVSVLLSPLLFLGTVYVLSYPIAIKKANRFQNERNNIIKSLTESDSLDKAIEKANNYVVSLNMTGRSDKRLSGIYDSLKRAKRSRLDSLKVVDIKSKSSLEESIEAARKYVNEDGAGQPEGYKGENVSAILDSLEKEKKDIAQANSESRNETDNGGNQVNSYSGNTSSQSEGGECSDISGVYTGTHREESGLYEVEGDGKFVIKNDCRYKWSSSTSIDGKYEGGPRSGEGVLKRKDKNWVLFNYAGGDELEGTYIYEAYVGESFWSGNKYLTWEEEVEIRGNTVIEWKFELERTSK